MSAGAGPGAVAAEIVDTILDLRDDGRGVLLITHSKEGLDQVDEIVRVEHDVAD